MINIILKCQEKNICKKIHSFHHYLTWFLAPIFIFSPLVIINFIKINCANHYWLTRELELNKKLFPGHLPSILHSALVGAWFTVANDVYMSI
jgi:hypothetical protein